MTLLLVQGALRQVWTPLKALTERLARSKEEALWGAAAQLYSLLFVCFDENVQRQEVLHALHGHLGSGSRQEVAGALQVGQTLRCIVSHPGVPDIVTCKCMVPMC